jgi:integrase
VEQSGRVDRTARPDRRPCARSARGGRAIFKAKPQPIAPATINRYAASLAAVVTWAIRRRIAPRGYVHPCRSVEKRPENNARLRFLSEDERARLLAACRASKWPRLYALVLMALTTGARKSELTGLHWGDVDLEQGVAHVGHTKNGDPRVLPLVPAVVDELRRIAGGRTLLLFPSRLRPDKPYNFEECWRVALRAAHIRGFTFHSLRHSCASMLAANGATLIEIADVLGHRDLKMTRRYSHLTTGHKAALVQRVLGGVR